MKDNFVPKENGVRVRLVRGVLVLLKGHLVFLGSLLSEPIHDFRDKEGAGSFIVPRGFKSVGVVFPCSEEDILFLVCFKKENVCGDGSEAVQLVLEEKGEFQHFVKFNGSSAPFLISAEGEGIHFGVVPGVV